MRKLPLKNLPGSKWSRLSVLAHHTIDSDRFVHFEVRDVVRKSVSKDAQCVLIAVLSGHSMTIPLEELQTDAWTFGWIAS